MGTPINELAFVKEAFLTDHSQCLRVDESLKGGRTLMVLFRAIYTSRPFGFEEGILNQILTTARRCNVRDDVTGALICRSDIYLQWLEGPEEKVRNTLERISRDDRHNEMKVQIAASVHERMFGDWAMLHDPAVSWIWTQIEVADGAVAGATPEKLLSFFLPLRGTSITPDYG